MANPQLDPLPQDVAETIDSALQLAGPETVLDSSAMSASTAITDRATVGPSASETVVAPTSDSSATKTPMSEPATIAESNSREPDVLGAVEEITLVDSPIQQTLVPDTTGTKPSAALTKPNAEATAQRSPDETLNEADTDPLATAAEVSTGSPSKTRANQRAGMMRIIPKVLGDYELLAELGKGGMGVVYRARQRRANRIVALKIIRPDRLGSLSPDSQAGIIERFRKEAQAAGRLQHDNIVTVYEVGEVDGCHFFSMQYVEGDSLADRLRQGPLDNQLAARLMEPICRAVHAAHQVGVLHRDIKPQNIMIEADGERPRIADFGLAKLADDEVEQTKSGEMMGTPPYMPPEQFGDAAKCTFKADIYALGATLYHSLSGRPPFQAATSIATMRQVLAEEPVRLKQLNAAVDVELETLCMKCLEKEPERRFESAAALADELQRYLKGEPILSRPISRVQRVRRWCRRNPLMATLIGAAAASMLFGFAALAFTAVKTEKARKVVEQSLDETQAAQALSEASFQDALSAVNEFFTRVSEDRLLNEPGAQGLRRELLELAQTYYLRLLDRRDGDGTVQEELAATHYRVGLITEELDSPKASLKSYETARVMLSAQIQKHPNSPSRQKFLSNTLNAMGRAYTRMGQLDKAEELFKESRTLRAALLTSTTELTERVEFDRLLANTDMNLALIQKQRLNLEAAQQLMQRAQDERLAALPLMAKNRKLRRDLAKGDYNLANLAIDRDDATQAPLIEKLIQQAIKRLEELLTEAPDDLEDRHLLALCYQMLADLEAALVGTEPNRLAQAIDHYQRSRSAFERLVTKNPGVPRYQFELAQVIGNLAELEFEQQHNEAATKLLDRAEEILNELLKDQPQQREYAELQQRLKTLRRNP